MRDPNGGSVEFLHFVSQSRLNAPSLFVTSSRDLRSSFDIRISSAIGTAWT